VSDGEFFKLMAYGIGGLSLLFLLASALISAGRCEPHERGRMRVVGEYGGTVEVCDGDKWVPAKMEVP